MIFRRIAVVILILLCSSLVSAQRSSTEPERINTNVTLSGPRHPLTLQEIVSLREIADSQISPDGKMIAFLVKQAFLDLNHYRIALYVVKTSGDSPPAKLLEENGLSELQWSPDSRWITYVSSKSGSPQIWRIVPSGGNSEQISYHSGPLWGYKWSPSGSQIAFLSSPDIEPEECSKLEDAGVVYDDHKDSHRSLIFNSWIHPPVVIRLMDASSGQERSIGVPSVSSLSGILRITWSPDNQHLAVEYKPSNEPEQMFNYSDIGLLDIQTGRFQRLITWAGSDADVLWAPDGKSFVFISQGDIDPREHFYDISLSIFRYSLTGGHADRVGGGLPKDISIHSLWWTNRNGALYGLRSDVGNLYEFPLGSAGQMHKVVDTSDFLSGCSLNEARTIAACSIENPTVPPEIGLVDLKTGRTTRLTSLNPEYSNIELSEVSELRWKNKYGTQTNGYLIKPLHYQSGKRYPLALILYGFYWKFTAQAQWISSYPAQVFASHGIAVLLMNFPREGGWHYGDSKRAAFSQGYSPLSSIESAVDLLVKTGIADPDHKAILGWSFGSFLTEFTITHSHLFQVASAGEGGLNNAGQYWLLGSAAMRYYLEGFFGGPPYKETYKNYEEFSPALNADKVNIPILREYGPEVGFQSFEFYTALRYYGVPVEQVFYPKETHIFSQPRHRVSSMQRNLDWLEFWLKGHEDPDPAKADRYVRWRELRKLQEEKEKKAAQ